MNQPLELYTVMWSTEEMLGAVIESHVHAPSHEAAKWAVLVAHRLESKQLSWCSTTVHEVLKPQLTRSVRNEIELGATP